VMIGGTPYSQLDSVTGGGVATWTQAAASLTNANIEVWVGVTNGSSATVTIACAANTTSMDISVTEWAGLVTTNLVDAGAATSGTTSPADAGPITTTHAHDLLLFGAADGAPNTWGSPGAGWTALTPMTGSITQAQWYRYVTSTGTYEPTASETANAWDAAVVALRAP